MSSGSRRTSVIPGSGWLRSMSPARRMTRATSRARSCGTPTRICAIRATDPSRWQSFERLLSDSGIAPETCVVFYGYGAPLGFWLLRTHGHEDVRMLMGPRDQWAQAGHEWSTEVPRPAASAHPPVVASADLLASREAVQDAIDDPAQILLDVRAPPEYSGELFWPSGATAGRRADGSSPGSRQRPDRLAPHQRRNPQGSRGVAPHTRAGRGHQRQGSDHLLHDRQQGKRGVVRAQVPPRLPRRTGLLRLLGRVGKGDRHADRKPGPARMTGLNHSPEWLPPHTSFCPHERAAMTTPARRWADASSSSRGARRAAVDASDPTGDEGPACVPQLRRD